MTATLFFSDGRMQSISGMFGEIIDKATALGACRIEASGGVLRLIAGDWVWVK